MRFKCANLKRNSRNTDLFKVLLEFFTANRTFFKVSFLLYAIFVIFCPLQSRAFSPVFQKLSFCLLKAMLLCSESYAFAA